VFTNQDCGSLSHSALNHIKSYSPSPKTFIGSLRLINPLVNVFHATFNAARREAPQVAGSQ
jgi:hypothetical protein